MYLVEWLLLLFMTLSVGYILYDSNVPSPSKQRAKKNLDQTEPVDLVEPI